MIPHQLFVKQPWYDLNNCGPALTASILNWKAGKRKFELTDVRGYDEDQHWWTFADIREHLAQHNIQTNVSRLQDDGDHIVLIRQWFFFRHWVLVRINNRSNFVDIVNPYYGVQKKPMHWLTSRLVLARTLKL
jgi:hypothetical protein